MVEHEYLRDQGLCVLLDEEMYNVYMCDIMEKGGAPSLDEIKQAAQFICEAKIQTFANYVISKSNPLLA